MGPEKLRGNAVGDTKVQIDDAVIEDLTNIRSIMYRKLTEQPRLIVSLRVDEESEWGSLLMSMVSFEKRGHFESVIHPGGIFPACERSVIGGLYVGRPEGRVT